VCRYMIPERLLAWQLLPAPCFLAGWRLGGGHIGVIWFYSFFVFSTPLFTFPRVVVKEMDLGTGLHMYLLGVNRGDVEDKEFVKFKS
jgi:hypothetical protein